MSTAPSIETHHIGWVFDAAADHFAEKLAECELDILRHERFIDTPYWTKTLKGKQDRKEAIERQQRYAKQYRECLEWIAFMRNEAANAGAQESAKGIVAAIRGRLKRKRK